MNNLTKTVPIMLPSVPNYISVNGVMTSISEFTEEELREIGLAWTELLIKKAKSK